MEVESVSSLSSLGLVDDMGWLNFLMNSLTQVFIDNPI